MSTLVLCALLVAGVVVMTPVADRIRIPLPVLLTLYGLLLPVLPGMPSLHIEPDLILPVVLPPLLFAATQRATVREFRDDARSILLLAVGLTLASAGAAAWVAHAAGLEWGPALVLGAVVAPPDPVAATAVARRLRLPNRLVTVLEGEGMFNDATALVLYGMAVAAVVTGHVTAGEVGGRLLLAVVAGVGTGLVGGVLTRWTLSALHDAAAETTMTVGMPFVVYLLAEQAHGSGVLAVLSLGLFLRSYGHSVLTSAGWLLGRAVWRYADYLVTSLVFVLIGFELTAVLKESSIDPALAGLTVAIVVTQVVLRMLWLFPAGALARFRLRGPNASTPYAGRETLVAGWAGMRGVVTVATALALPLTTESGGPFPHRNAILVVGLTTVLATLVIQGLTLAPLVRALRVGSAGDTAREIAALRQRAAGAALDEIHASASGQEVPEPVRRAAVLQYEGYLAAQDALNEARGHHTDDRVDPDYPQALDDLLRRANEVERGIVLEARRRGEVSAEAADEVLADVEGRAVRELS
jgi:Na+/H+ antiporter